MKTTINNDGDKRVSFLNDIFQVMDSPRLFISNKCLFHLDSSVNIEDLSRVVKEPVANIVTFFWDKGQEVTKNQNLSEDVLSQYCSSLGLSVSKIEINFNEIIDKYLNSLELEKFDYRERTIVVGIMGHIDHGKTTLTDNICKTNIQRRELGGITQKINISSTEFEERNFVFLDTPGHSDFIRLRKRGISLIDIVILVIDSQEGIMPQTEEIINYLHEYSLPAIIFINQKKEEKDKDFSKLLSQLQEKNLIPLEWGGDTMVIFGNAKNSAVVPQLLENISLLVSCKSNFSGPVFGVVIDSYLHPRFNSIVNKVLIQGGILKNNDYLFLGSRTGQIKTMCNSNNVRIKSAGPGEIILLTGYGHFAELGEKFIVINHDEHQELTERIESKKLKTKNLVISDSFSTEKKNVNLFLIADSENSLQTLADMIQKKNQSNVFFNLAGLVVGQLYQSDLELALVTKSIILAFNVNINPFVSSYIKENKLIFFSNNVIYEISKFIDNIIKSYQTKKKTDLETKKGEAIIKIVYSFSKGDIAGCRVTEGVLDRSSKICLLRNNQRIYTGKMKSLEIGKVSVKEAKAGQDCGIVLNKFNNYKVNDLIVAFQLTDSMKD